MRLLLIRHGETVDNVARKCAGTLDSALTTHGVLQASRLAAYLAATDVTVSHIFSSDLQRAFKTAEAIRLAQPKTLKPVIQLTLLREQDFGSYEGESWQERLKESKKAELDANHETNSTTEGFRDVESKQSMITRVDSFLNQYLIPLLGQGGDGETVVVVAHGIILNVLWRSILSRFEPRNVAVASGVAAGGDGMGLEYLGGWSNTGYLDLDIKTAYQSLTTTNTEPTNSIPQSEPNTTLIMRQPVPDLMLPDGSSFASAGADIKDAAASPINSVLSSKFSNLSLKIMAVNSQEHLKGLKKTRGGIGSSKHDENQKTMDSFFKR